MIVVLDRQTPSLRIGQLVRIHPDKKDQAARFGTIAKVFHGPRTSYHLDQTWGRDERRYFNKDLEPVIELFFAPMDETDRSQGYRVIIRNRPLRLLGMVVAEGGRWRIKPEGKSEFLPDSCRTRKRAALALIERRRRATKSPDL